MPLISPVRIFVIGAPAAGKSTARAYAKRWFFDRGVRVRDLELDAYLRALLSPNAVADTYWYNHEGALILGKPEEQIAEAMKSFLNGCQIALHDRGFVAEFAPPSANAIRDLMDQSLFQASLVLNVTASLDTRLRRNASRGNRWVPEEIVSSYPASLSDEMKQFLHSSGATLATVPNSGSIGDMDDTVSRILVSQWPEL